MISKLEEAGVVAKIWNMGAQSLDPDSYVELERILGIISSNRNIDYKAVSSYQMAASGKVEHASDCSTSNAPAMLPGPCDCDIKAAD